MKAYLSASSTAEDEIAIACLEETKIWGRYVQNRLSD